MVSKEEVEETRNEQLQSSNHEDSPKEWRETIQALQKGRSTP